MFRVMILLATGLLSFKTVNGNLIIIFRAAYGLSANSPRRHHYSATAFSGASSRQPCLRLLH
jgi:hypothetical protein